MIGDETIALMVEKGTFLVSTNALTENWDVSRHPPALQAKAADVFPRARESLSRAIAAGVKIACGSDAPAIWHGRNAEGPRWPSEPALEGFGCQAGRVRSRFRRELGPGSICRRHLRPGTTCAAPARGVARKGCFGVPTSGDVFS